MRETLKRSTLVLGAVFMILQVVPPPIQPLTPPSASQSTLLRNVGNHEVGAILARACKDCHSNQTAVPWYGHVAPISWMLAKDVRDGRKKLDFSDWDSRQHSANELEEICDAVSNKTMPLRAYVMVHHDARLSTHDVDAICNWADSSSHQKYASQAH